MVALRQEGLAIDLVFCTGDIGYGETSSEPLSEQYATAKAFFDKVLRTCELPNDRLFFVPGNHDIDRKKVLPSQTEYFRKEARNPDEINQMFHDHSGEVERAMERLEQYRKFVAEHYQHILLDNNTNFGAWIAVNGMGISIAGLNSAWTCADNEGKGKLWLAGKAQLNACETVIKSHSPTNVADLRIALIHHPLDWLKPDEAKQLRGRIENDFDFLLHGHAHDQWVRETVTPYQIVIAAGAATADTEAEFGYNLMQLRPGTANIYLRRYDRNKGDGWGKEIIAGRADDGIWPIKPPRILTDTDHPAVTPVSPYIQSGDDSAANRGHFGLDEILASCSAQLKRTPLLAFYGLAGVGKTVIVEELHRLPEWCGCGVYPSPCKKTAASTTCLVPLPTT